MGRIDRVDEAGGRSARVVVVDDEPSVVRFVGRLLELSGYEVGTYTNPRKVLTDFTRTPTHADLLITDQTMPGLTGIELIEQLRLRDVHIPVLLFTGFSDLMSEDMVSPWRPSAFMAKPIDAHALLQHVRTLLATG